MTAAKALCGTLLAAAIGLTILGCEEDGVGTPEPVGAPEQTEEAADQTGE